MKNILMSMVVVCLAFGISIHDASARGFGGGRGFGMHRTKNMFSNFSPRKQPASMIRRVSPNKRGGIFRGILIGGLLASLFMGNGLTSALFSWLIVGAVLMLIINYFRRRQYVNSNNQNSTWH